MVGSIIISDGHVIDPDTGVDQLVDLFVEDGRISKLCSRRCSQPAAEDRDRAADNRSSQLPVSDDCRASRVFDASNCYVTAGLIDCHVHVYQYATPLGIDVDERCLSRGVTSVVDAGSAGAGTFLGLRKFIAERCKTRIFAFLHIAEHGLAAAGCVSKSTGGESDSLNVVNVKSCCETINNNRDMLVGIKVRLATLISNHGKNEQELLRRTLEASQLSQVPVMVHHAMSSVLHEEKKGLLGTPGSLKRGDVYTHCFHGHAPHLLDPDTGTVRTSVWEARRRGVLFDMGHGQGSFSWRLAEQCAKEGFWPDIISSDLHTDSQDGPAYDLMCVMTKMLYLGMPIKNIIAAVTSKPATAIGKSDEIGNLQVGKRADITVFKVVDLASPVLLEDSFGETRSITKAFQPVAVFVNGEQHPVIHDRPWPNAAVAEQCKARFAHSQK